MNIKNIYIDTCLWSTLQKYKTKIKIKQLLSCLLTKVRKIYTLNINFELTGDCWNLCSGSGWLGVAQ